MAICGRITSLGCIVWIAILMASFFIVSFASANGDVPPVAQFTSNTTFGSPPLAVQFNDQSLNNPGSYIWNFGDMEMAFDVPNPVHVYQDEGLYTVYLTVSNAAGSNSATIANYINVTNAPLPPPVADFEANITSGTMPTTVQFYDRSKNNPSSYVWNFGDGTTSNLKNPVHIFSSEGIYTVSLGVSNQAGSNSILKKDYIVINSPVPPPVVDFTAYPVSGPAPLIVQFLDASTNNPNAWSWTFGDGVTSNEQNPQHSYSTAGQYTVTLRASNNAGSYTLSKNAYITVTSQPPVQPVADFAANIRQGTMPLTVQFIDQSSGPATSWLWNFGDNGTSSLKSPSHTYTQSGSYSVSLGVSNSVGSNSVTKQNYIQVDSGNLKPLVNFTANVTSGGKPLVVQFSDLSLQNPTTWLWSFGDGSTSSERNPLHTYATSGIYSVTLSASNSAGSNQLIRYNYINVVDISPPVVDFNVNITSGYYPLSVKFTDLSQKNPTVWSWDFGDNGTSSEQNPVYVYTRSGQFTVRLTATNAGGSGTATKNAYINVSQQPVPIADFTVNNTAGYAPLTIKFTDKSNNLPSSWLWNFGDSGTSTVMNPDYVYTKAGVYNVTLTAYNSGGSNTTLKANLITVTNPPVAPVADFSVNNTVGVSPLPVKFTDLSTNTPTMWSWDFGDGGTSPVKNPDYIYTKTGIYTVKLTASNTAGSNTTTKNSYINVTTSPPVPVAGFTANKTSGYTPLIVKFTDQSSGSPTQWLWEFGTGATSSLQNPEYVYTTQGLYSVRLTANNSAGSSVALKSSYINVSASPPAPVAAFTANQTIGYAPLSVKFTDQSSNNPTQWLWEFGTGATSPLQNPEYVYSTQGLYSVRLTATNSAGSSVALKSSYINVNTSPPAPVAQFVANTTTGYVPLALKFTDQSSNNPTQWLWEFGTGATSSLQNPEYLYSRSGIYPVKLTAINSFGSNSALKTGYITVSDRTIAPVADFGANQTSGNIPLPIKFTDFSKNTPTMWVWEFGDGGTSNLQNPDYLYTKSGVYNVRLTAANSVGINSTQKNAYINSTAPVTTYTIFASSTQGGSISPSGVVSVKSGNSQTFVFNPQTCYEIQDVTVDGNSVGRINSYSFTNVTSNHSIQVSFRLLQYLISATALTGGSITPSGPVYVNCNSSQLFTITPFSCSDILDVLVDSKSVGKVTNYTFTNVTGPHSIIATFNTKLFVINATAGTGGAISPSGPVSVNCGMNQTFTFTPEQCYSIADVLVDNTSMGKINNYTFSTITGPHSIIVKFEKRIFNITASTGDHGTITPSGVVQAGCGEDRTFTFTPEWGYVIQDVLVDGSSIGAVQSYTFKGITQDHTIKSFFNLVPVGSIRISSIPTGASIYIDGVYRDTTDRFITGVPSGKHEIVLKYPFYADYKTTVDVLAGATVTVPVAYLIPGTPTPGTPTPTQTQGPPGMLQVTSYPLGAIIYLDDAYKGIAPLLLNDVSSGSHQIKATFPGYIDYYGSVSVSPSVVTPFIITMQKS